MSENQPNLNIIPITPNQAEELALMETAQAQHKIIEFAGRVILQKEIYGLVVDQDESGNENPLSVIRLAGNDIGTRINQDKNEGNHPTIESAWSAIQLGQDSDLQPVENVSLENTLQPDSESEADLKSEKELIELHEWGLSIDASVEGAVQQLKGSIEASQELNKDVHILANEWTEITAQLRLHLSNENTQQAQLDLREFSQKLVNVRMKITDFASRKNILQPVGVRSALEDSGFTINYLAEGISGNDGPIGTEMLYSIAGRMQNENTLEQVLSINDSLEASLQQALVNVGSESTEGEIDKKAQEYVNAEIAALAAELKGNISDEVVQASVLKLERYIDQLADKEASTLPARIVRNDVHNQKTRAGGTKEGQKTDSRTYAAEIAVDMLSGAFDSSNMSHDPITIYANGNINGQHRAAALMALYGGSWQLAAAQRGIKIVHA